MLDLPNNTEFNRRIPKQKFYENLTVTPALRRVFTEQIKGIYWRNKIAVSTMNLAVGEAVTEIEVFEIRLNEPRLEEAVLRQIDKKVPYHILFLLTCGGKVQAWIGYKETAGTGSSAFKVGTYYHTDWLSEDALRLRVTGLSMDAVYESFVRQIAGDALSSGGDESLKASVERNERKKQLEKQIFVLESKIRREKQFNRQVEMNVELKRLRKELEKEGETIGK